MFTGVSSYFPVVCRPFQASTTWGRKWGYLPTPKLTYPTFHAPLPLLSDSRIRAAKPKEKAYKLFDSQALYLVVVPTGACLWRFKYHLNGREKLLSLGRYPDVLLGRAREKRDEARRLIADGTDPSIQRQIQKTEKAETFAAIALEWLEMQRKRFASATMEKAEWTFRDLINPFIGSRPIREIQPLELLNVFRRLEARGKHETAHRTKQRCGQVFRYAVAAGRAQRDPTQDLRGALGRL